MDTKIDITQKRPVRAPKSWKRDLNDFLFYLIQWTWGLSVNIVGVLLFLSAQRL